LKIGVTTAINSSILYLMSALLITATDTDAGKTVLTTAIAAYWQRYCQDRALGIIKPLQSGTGDREIYRRLFDLDQSPEELNPLYFSAPLAPPVAAEKEGRRVELERVWPIFQQLERRKALVLVEALGGLGSPVTPELTVADLARDWRLPTVLVVPVRLGAIAHTVANVALARQSGVELRGIVLNCTEARTEEEIADLTPIEAIESFVQVPILGVLPYFENAEDLPKLAAAAAQLDLERLLPISLVAKG
jgi:dethiobiotin synthetase